METKSKTLRGRILWTVVLALALSLGAIATASAKDRNNDRIPDRWERANDLSLKVNQAKRDQDRDNLGNRGEYQAGTDPHAADTDGDGTPDGDEGAGTITAWDPETGELTINLFGGDTVTGTVTDETKIQCAPDDSAEPTDDTDTKTGRPPADQAAPEPPTSEDPPAEDPPSDENTPPEGGPRHGGPAHDGEGCQHGVPCSADDLAVDETVQEAHLSATADGLVFDEIKLG
jgi:hypothetical protein